MEVKAATLAQRIRRLRKEKDLKQQLADQFSVKPRTCQGYECGESYPEAAKLAAVADFFDVSLDCLMGRSEVRERRQPLPLPSPNHTRKEARHAL